MLSAQRPCLSQCFGSLSPCQTIPAQKIRVCQPEQCNHTCICAVSCRISRTAVTSHASERRRRSVITTAALGVCFDKACQEAQDQIFLAVIAAPLLCLAAAVLYAVLRKPKDEASFPDTADT